MSQPTPEIAVFTPYGTCCSHVSLLLLLKRMIEVFKTNVSCYEQAAKLVEDIHKSFEGYIANFDLDDCDRILRIVSAKGKVQSMRLIDFLKAHGYHAEVLPG